MKIRLRPLWIITGCLISSAALAETVRDQIHSVVLNHLHSYYQQSGASTINSEQRIEISVAHIDPRLTLPDCSEDLLASLNSNQRPVGKLSVKVQCPGQQPWSKYVPAEVHVFTPVLVANRNLARGTLLTVNDLELVEMDLATVRRTTISDPSQIDGMELRQSISAGNPVVMESLLRPTVVKRGDLVQILAENGSIRIRQTGEALQDGEVGKLINVRNSSSELVVQAIVIGTGQTKIPL